MAGGTALIQAVAGGVGLIGAGIATNAADCAKFKKQNVELREKLKESNIDASTKQKIIVNLNKKIEELNKKLKEEKEKSDKNDEKIRILQEQLNEVYETLKIAEVA